MERLENLKNFTFPAPTLKSVGRVVKCIGTTIEVSGLSAPVGARCSIDVSGTRRFADVIAFDSQRTKLQMLDDGAGVELEMRVRMESTHPMVAVGDELLGCVIDPTGQVLIGELEKAPDTLCCIHNSPLTVAERGEIDTQIQTGIRALDSILPIGLGQRMGLFAGTGVGKSKLMAMITKNTDADIVIIGLIGERGREVTEFYYSTLSEEARRKSIVVTAPADTSPIMRLQCAESATAIAEHYRDQGKNVLLLLDSVTRYAQAQREVALAAGEPPATKGYPPSVFKKLPHLIERAGITRDSGSITAIYTVLTEGDDLNDPVSDAARGVLDGHVVLSRDIANRGIYPAIDVCASISRLAPELQEQSLVQVVGKVKNAFSLLDANHELISMGLIEAGKNPYLDTVIAHQPQLWGLVRQGLDESSTIAKATQDLAHLSSVLE